MKAITGKLIITAFIIFLIPVSINADPSNCSYTWTLQNSNTTNLFLSVEAVSDQVCWAAGNNANVRRTTNGGIDWLDANPNPGVITGNVVNIEAIDADNAWATSHLTNLVAYIYKTTNGGTNWIQVYSVSQIFINGVHMNSLTEGFAFGDPISMKWNILTTTNGGINWNQLPTAPAGSPPAQGFRNSFKVALPYIWFSSYPATIMRSTNSGLNWTQHTVPPTGMSTIFSIHFDASGTGYSSSINMVKSTDWGTTYQQHSVPGLGNITSIDGSGNDLWYVRGSFIYHSTDMGTSWTQVLDASITMSDIDLYDEQSGCAAGWAVGYGGKIYKLNSDVVGISSNNQLPADYMLEQNFPNPFNPVSKIKYQIPNTGLVRLTIFNSLGQNIETIVNEIQTAGTYEINFDGSNYPSGMYFYRIEAGSFFDTKKMMLIK